MKEVMAFLRANKVNGTKKALADAGFPSFTCRKVLGRGKKTLDSTLVKLALSTDEVPMNAQGEALSEHIRLVPKRFFTLIVEDGQVDEAARTILRVNQTGNPGDGRIFILDIPETHCVRTGSDTL